MYNTALMGSNVRGDGSAARTAKSVQEVWLSQPLRGTILQAHLGELCKWQSHIHVGT